MSYLKGLQGLPWELETEARPASDDSAACFLYDVRAGKVALRGRLKKNSDDFFRRFETGLFDSFPEARKKQFSGAVVRLWMRWLGALEMPSGKDAAAFSFENGRRVGELLKAEYDEGVSGNLAGFLLDKRLHLGRVGDFLKMRGWLLGTIEHLRKSPDSEKRERAEILSSNFSSIVLRALHNGGPNYAADAVSKLGPMMQDLDTAVRNLTHIEPEAARHLRNNRSTIITKALHSGQWGYGAKVTVALPSAIRKFKDRIEASSPEEAERLRANERTMIYRALTNGRLDRLRSN